MKASEIVIFADFNNADERNRIRLNTNGTFRDLNKNDISLYEGLELVLDDNEELKIRGVIEFSEFEKIWVANVNWEKLERY